MAPIGSLVKRVRNRSWKKSSKDLYGANGLSECAKKPATNNSSEPVDTYGANGISECASYLATNRNSEFGPPRSVTDDSALYRNTSLTPYEDVYGESHYFAWSDATMTGTFGSLERTDTWTSHCSELDSNSGPHELHGFCNDQALPIGVKVSELEGDMGVRHVEIVRPSNEEFHKKRLESHPKPTLRTRPKTII